MRAEAGSPRPVRCAVYTRKSTDEGLNQAFNSLDAQREAGEAYVASQRHEGWSCSAERYDDGGFSGGSMDRPALKRLLADIAAGQIDVVVLYKIDRLTRSLSDFARIVEVLDRAGASFVSVTQAFNTTTSMGRLTLNVLLSFAQFEREVGAERVRDKVAASKKRGMWMGGVCPLGYDVQDRGLVVNEAEAETIRTIFASYLRLGSALVLEAELLRQGVISKRRRSRAGGETGGKPLSRGVLYLILRNVLYVGRVAHGGQSYPGQHEPIIDPDTYARTQDLLKANAVTPRQDAGGAGQVPLLAGLLFDQHGRRMSPSHTSKGVKRYRYYNSRTDDQTSCREPIIRVPAGEVENIVIARLRALLRDTRAMHDLTDYATLSTRELHSFSQRATDLKDRLGSAAQEEQARVLTQLICRVDLSTDSLTITVDLSSLDASERQLRTSLSVPCKLIRRTKEVRLIVPPSSDMNYRLDTGLLKLLVRAHQVRKAFDRCGSKAMAELAQQLGYHADYCTILLKLSYLSPKLVEAILSSRQAQQLTRQQLARTRELPFLWSNQASSLRPALL